MHRWVRPCLSEIFFLSEMKLDWIAFSKELAKFKLGGGGGTQIIIFFLIFWQSVQPWVWNPYPYQRIFLTQKTAE